LSYNPCHNFLTFCRQRGEAARKGQLADRMLMTPEELSANLKALQGAGYLFPDSLIPSKDIPLLAEQVVSKGPAHDMANHWLHS
jgi:hypothetical protein